MSDATTRTVLKDATFEAMEVGQRLGPIELVVDDHYVKQFAFAVDDYAPIEAGRATGAHAAILVPELLRLLNTRYDPNTEVGLHQREEVWIHSPVEVGERVVLSGSFVDKFVKRGKGYVVTDASAHSLEDGRLLVRHRSTEVARVDEGIEMGARTAPRPRREVKGELPAGAPVAESAVAGLSPGTAVLGPVKSLHQDQMSVFSNVAAFWRTIHTDPGAAAKAGSERTIAQGLMEAMYLSEMGASFFGDSWLRSGWMSVAFLAPVFAGDELSAKGVVVEPETREDPERLELEAWVENQDGVKAAVGWLGAIVG
ncbi:MAG TPA: MaoC/PaaZ C-terminal domain-containing protein [Solirubrobacterales bacterium]|nr:MaoC/PaaZ C-terminal domain-containing protein [Solirubrobacterales bacterium]